MSKEKEGGEMKYELLDVSGCPIYIIDINVIDKSYVDLKVWQADSWDSETNEPYEKEFIAEVHWKYDNCTHWNFYGMDYIPQTPNENINPGYYHICGSFFMTRWIIMFAFVRKVMNEILGDKTDDYEDSDKQLDEQLLKTYTIRKVE
jgi:hypothetical protein